MKIYRYVRNSVKASKFITNVKISFVEDTNATGMLFWDDGESIEFKNYLHLSFSGDETSLSGEPTLIGDVPSLNIPPMANLTLMNLPNNITTLTLEQDGQSTDLNTFELGPNNVLKIHSLNVDMTKPFTFKWSSGSVDDRLDCLFDLDKNDDLYSQRLGFE